MTFVRLKGALHDGALEKQIRKSGHIERIQQVDFQKETISNMIPIKRNTFHQRNMSDKDRFLAVGIGIGSIAKRQRIIDGYMEASDCEIN